VELDSHKAMLGSFDVTGGRSDAQLGSGGDA